MKLKEYIENNRGRTIKLGVKCGFIWCGVIDDNAEVKLSELSSTLKRKLKNTYKNAKCGDYKDRLALVYDTFVPLLDREIKECYPSILDADDIVLIDGYETGGYWTLNEYKTKHKSIYYN